MRLQQIGYHGTKEQAERFALSKPNLEVKYYPNRHLKNDGEWGVWNKNGSFWEFIELPVDSL